MINCLCDTALLYGFAEEKSHIDDSLIEVVIRERQKSLAAGLT
jgi:hypothetical protein